MRMLTGRNHPGFNLDGGRPQGITTVIRAARDPVARAPEDQKIQLLLQGTLCRAKLNETSTAWEIAGVGGGKREIPLGAPFDMWKKACGQLLQEAMHES